MLITTSIDCDPTVNYAMQQNDVPVVKALRIVNETDAPIRDAIVRITSEPAFTATWESRIAVINPQETFTFGAIDLPLSHDFLASLTERVAGCLHVEFFREEAPLARLSKRIEVLAFDEWNGLQSIPEVLAAFVIPNHPAVESVLSDAAGILGTWTGDSAISGYESKDPHRVALTAGAVYAALQKRNIRYINPPASFEEVGQKIRLPDRILESRLATCLDLAVFVSACLEQAGLHPLVVLTEGHAFVGVWLEEETFADVATDDLLRLRKRVELGQITVFETTLLTSEAASPFDNAMNEGLKHLEDEGAFRCVIDIRRARKSRIRPLPLRIEGTSTTVFSIPGKKSDADVLPILNLPSLIAVPNESAGATVESSASRLDRWKQKLLDLTLHNRLLNFRESKKSLPVLCPDLAALEDALADGAAFRVYPRLGDLGESDPRNAAVHRQRTGQDSLNEMLREEFHARRLHADVTEGEVNRRLLEIYREAKSSIEENGANTLYLALGFLAWYETKTSSQRRLAPIILIPLEIERRSLQEGFSIRQGDDEPMVNVTLLTHLAADFELHINGLDPIPMDEHGIDVSLILRKFRESIVAIDRWEVLEYAYIGHFSFTKFLMWRDLEVRAGDLERSAIVRHLIHTPTEVYPDNNGVFPDPDHLDETHSPEATFCPLSADSSQLAAVHAAAEGKSFVLHGPPGTGKSQTITNIIAHNLAVGKTVLFVSEKRAALAVVHRRLEKVGLGPFCLELHSNKSHKKEVLFQLEQALNIQADQLIDEWRHEAQRLQTSRAELNAFVKALHAIRPSGESVFHGISQLIAHRDVPLVRMMWPAVGQIDRGQLASLRDMVRRLQIAVTQIGYPATHVWSAASCEIWTPEFRNDVERLLEELREIATSLAAAAGGISATMGMEHDNWSRVDLKNLSEIVAALCNCPPLPQALLLAREWEQAKTKILELVAHGRQRDSLRANVFAKYSDGILALDLDALAQQWAIAQKAWALPRWLGSRKVRQALLSVTRQGYIPQNEEIPPSLDSAMALRREEQFLREAKDQAGEFLGVHWRGGEADWNAVEELLERAEALRKLASRVAGVDVEGAVRFRSQWAKLIAAGHAQLAGDGPIGQQLQAYGEAFAQFTKVENDLNSLLGLDSAVVWGAAGGGGFLPDFQERVGLWLQNLNSLKTWCYWRAVRKEALAANLQPLIEVYESQNLPTEKLQDTFTRAFYQWWSDAIIGSEPVLCGFISSDFEDKIRRFREIDDRYTQLTQQEIQARVAARLPHGMVNNPNSEMGLLRRQCQKQRAHLPVRALFQKIPNLLPRLKPCLLMSPISIAQYLDPAHPPFDLVIFDEASQIPVWDAVGAIARGKEAIIVGDPKQLPPTNFFSRVETGEGADTDDSLVEDLESILDDCIAAQLPERHLNWHYRSRHESLITFSNFHYYDNRLLTFPSPHQELGVTFRQVPGVYDKGKTRTNKAEAEAIVAEVMRRLSDPAQARFSIGVITFSLAQQLLVDDLLEEARRQYPEIDPYFSDSADEPVFVKNLENVQGDERDVILFSICYGPDAAGRVSMNFGPLNRDGGERRLNVAITRARQEVVVFSTLRAEQIDLSRTRAKGVTDLKCFLDYAERGPVAIAERRAADPTGECESPFESQVHEALQKKGYTVHPQVGCSGYRIDLAVVDPNQSGRYLLGIECDGANYHRSKTARDRDKLRESVLRGLGWKLHRIWSTDWWERPAEELARIEASIEEAKRTLPLPETVAEPTGQLFAARPVSVATLEKPSQSGLSLAKPPALPASAPTYEPFALRGIKGSLEDFYDTRANNDVAGIIEAVVNKEGPVCLEIVARRVAEHWTISRLSSRVITRIKNMTKGANVQVVREGKVDFLWPLSLDLHTFTKFRLPGGDERSRRNANELPPQEISNAALYVLEQHISLPAAELVRETARLLGFQRTGPTVDKSIRAGIELLIRRGFAKEEKEVLVHIG